jgi:BMFP domain-containing protein YqiC
MKQRKKREELEERVKKLEEEFEKTQETTKKSKTKAFFNKVSRRYKMGLYMSLGYFLLTR